MKLLAILLGIVVLCVLVYHHRREMVEGLENQNKMDLNTAPICNSEQEGVKKLCGNPDIGFYACSLPNGEVLRPCGQSDPAGFGGNEATCKGCKYCGWCIKRNPETGTLSGTCVAGDKSGPLNKNLKCNEYQYSGRVIPQNYVPPQYNPSVMPKPPSPAPVAKPTRTGTNKGEQGSLPTGLPNRPGTTQQVVGQCLDICGM